MVLPDVSSNRATKHRGALVKHRNHRRGRLVRRSGRGLGPGCQAGADAVPASAARSGQAGGGGGAEQGSADGRGEDRFLGRADDAQHQGFDSHDVPRDGMGGRKRGAALLQRRDPGSCHRRLCARRADEVPRGMAFAARIRGDSRDPAGGSGGADAGQGRDRLEGSARASVQAPGIGPGFGDVDRRRGCNAGVGWNHRGLLLPIS